MPRRGSGVGDATNAERYMHVGREVRSSEGAIQVCGRGGMVSGAHEARCRPSDVQKRKDLYSAGDALQAYNVECKA